MNDDQQATGLNAGEENVMERVLGTFDGLYDNATSFISSAAANVGDVTRDLGDGSVKDIAGDIAGDAGNIATSLGETATGVATSVGTVVGDKLDAAVTFARGLLGG
jgi:hypothetical protein